MNGENAYNRAQKMRESLKESAVQTEEVLNYKKSSMS